VLGDPGSGVYLGRDDVALSRLKQDIVKGQPEILEGMRHTNGAEPNGAGIIGGGQHDKPFT
jgi:hypothetical protein